MILRPIEEKVKSLNVGDNFLIVVKLEKDEDRSDIQIENSVRGQIYRINKKLNVNLRVTFTDKPRTFQVTLLSKEPKIKKVKKVTDEVVVPVEETFINPAEFWR